jgi:ATP-dependent Clp protease ATP-binding subunit ClpC
VDGDRCVVRYEQAGGAEALRRGGERAGRWTPSARRALDHAGEQARELGHNFVGTEHALLGLLAARDGLAAHVLADLRVTRQGVLSELPGPWEPRPYECLGVMPRLKRSLEHARRVAGRFGHQVAGTEHLLAGILAVPDALAVEILQCCGVSADAARAALAERLDVDPEELVVAARRRRRLLNRTRAAT